MNKRCVFVLIVLVLFCQQITANFFISPHQIQEISLNSWTYYGAIGMHDTYNKQPKNSNLTVTGVPHIKVIQTLRLNKRIFGRIYRINEEGENANTKLWMIAFKGSTSWEDITISLTSTPTVCAFGEKMFGECHSGYHQRYQQKASSLRKALKSAGFSSTDSLIVTGHSMGAAMATFAALDIFQQFPQTKLFVTLFGSPRVGNDPFVTHFRNIATKENSISVVSAMQEEEEEKLWAQDPIALVPFDFVDSLPKTLVACSKELCTNRMDMHFRRVYFEMVMRRVVATQK